MAMTLPGKVKVNKYKTHINRKFECKFCKMPFVSESRYMAHECKQMKRLKQFQSPQGQSAWNFYQQWMKKQQRTVYKASSFLDSRYFRTFMNFAEFVQRVDMPLVDRFIWLMVEKKYPPTLWTTNEAYVLFLEFLDYKTTPDELFTLSLQTLFKAAVDADVDIKDVFDIIHPNDLIHMIRKRKISGWLLLNSSAFERIFTTKMSPEQQMIVETLIRPDHWYDQFEQHSEYRKKVREVLDEIGI